MVAVRVPVGAQHSAVRTAASSSATERRTDQLLIMAAATKERDGSRDGSRAAVDEKDIYLQQNASLAPLRTSSGPVTKYSLSLSVRDRLYLQNIFFPTCHFLQLGPLISPMSLPPARDKYGQSCSSLRNTRSCTTPRPLTRIGHTAACMNMANLSFRPSCRHTISFVSIFIIHDNPLVVSVGEVSAHDVSLALFPKRPSIGRGNPAAASTNISVLNRK